MMIDVRPFKAEDMLCIIREGVKEIGLKAEPTDEMRELAEDREKSGKCFTGWVDGKIVGAGGLDILWKGVANVWLMLTPYINYHVKEGYKCIRHGFKKLLNKNKLHRIESYGRVDFPECHILFKHLGFKVEGIAKKKTPDKVDCIMYARVKDD